ncbi:MAG: 3-deoxy-D-manno-octulosonic acid transferase [Nitrospinota bacterium]|nr:3-deoxy-D-manno-octulosonic acid transferase [Nitrospinota bacterium]
MSRILYNAALYLGAPALAGAFAWKMASKPAYREGAFQKLGLFLPRQTRRTIWIHAVSVGETMAALRLARKLAGAQSRFRIMFSTSTPTGQQVARRELSPEANVFYFPFDFPGSAARAVAAINPAALALVDTEFWPNVIHACARRGAAVILVNGRMSDRSYPRYMKFRKLIKPTLEEVSLFMTQGEKDRERFLDIGAAPEKVLAAGNLKFDQETAPISAEQSAAIKKSLGIGPEEQVVVLGSVHQGEQAAIRAAAGVLGPGRRLVIAPRRIDNLEWIERELEPYGLRISRRSQWPAMAMADFKTVPIIDTFGELGKIYSIASVAFVGGSLISHGGQNPLEPASRGVPSLFGPGMSNFSEASQALVAANGAFTVATQEEMGTKLAHLMADEPARLTAGAAARAVVERNQGATTLAAERIMSLARAD